jgi:hypothetical protein
MARQLCLYHRKAFLMSDTMAKTCPRCHRPVDLRKGFFVDHNSGVTMHSVCFLGSDTRPLRETEQVPVAVDRLAA